jgi:phage gp45-like
MSRNVVARLLHAVSLGRITIVDDTGSIQKLQVTGAPGSDGAQGVEDGVYRVAQFGLASNPPITSEVLVLHLWGNRTLSIAIGTNHQPSRLKNLGAGDSALYDVRGAYAWFKDDGLVIDAAGLAITVQNFSSCTVKGDLHVTGDVIADSEGSPISLVNHVHGLSGGPTTTAPIPG